jgi:hypothetical protein
MTAPIFVMIPVVDDRDVTAPILVVIPVVDHRDMAVAITIMISLADVQGHPRILGHYHCAAGAVRSRQSRYRQKGNRSQRQSYSLHRRSSLGYLDI